MALFRRMAELELAIERAELELRDFRGSDVSLGMEFRRDKVIGLRTELKQKQFELDSQRAVPTAPSATPPKPRGDGAETAPKKRPRKAKPRRKADLILQIIEAAIDAGHFEMTPKKIAEAASVSPRYVNQCLKERPEIRSAYAEYKRRSAGRGPARSNDL
jgi:hypothetical protein